MKILHVTLSLDERIGGPPRALATLVRAQVARGDDVSVLPCQFADGPQVIASGVSDRLRVYQPVTHSNLFWYDRRLKHAIQEAARDREILHIHGTWRYHSRGSARVAWELGIPYVFTPDGNFGITTRRHKRWLKTPYLWMVERPTANRAAAIQCMSIKERDELHGLNLKPRVFVVPNPLDTDLLAVTPDYTGLDKCCPGLAQHHRVITYLGRFCFVKRLHVLLEAFIRIHPDYPDCRLLIAGPHEDPRIAAALRRRIQHAGVADRVWLPGMVRGAIKCALLNRADVYAQPSAHENFGISIAEAMIFSTPCVVSDGVALGADIEQCNAGIQCPSDAVSFESALRAMLEDDARRLVFAGNAETLAQRFLPESVAETLAREYATCLESR